METQTQSIAEAVKKCFKTFRELSKYDHTQVQASVTFTAWNDEAGRLRVWSGNLGAHQTGSLSLSHRLRHSPSIQEDIIETLEVLVADIQEAVEELEKGRISTSEVDDDYVAELFRGVSDSITGLFRLSTVIRNPSRRDQLIHRSEIDKHLVVSDQNHVRALFPQSQEDLVERLGRANSQRRANFWYLQRHHQKMMKGLEDDEDETRTNLPGTIATELDVQALSGDNDDSRSVTESTTSYTPSLFGDRGRRFPKKPAATTNDETFTCPLCFYTIKANNIAAWRKHVFVDLQPYVCLFAPCTLAHKLFVNRRDWYGHMCTEHIGIDTTTLSCPLCVQILPRAVLEKHLGKHLEELALFTLPTALFDANTEQDIGDNSEQCRLYAGARPKKTQAELDAEMDDYWGGGKQMQQDFDAAHHPSSLNADSAIATLSSAERLTDQAADTATGPISEKALSTYQRAAREEEEQRDREATSNAKSDNETKAVYRYTHQTVVPVMARHNSGDLSTLKRRTGDTYQDAEEREALGKQILAEQEQKKKKQKEIEEEFELKVKERFMKAGEYVNRKC